jgi:hypothetical protein
MEISTNLNLGTIIADLDIDGTHLMEAVDVEDIGTRMQPWIESAVEREVGDQLSDFDWDFVDDMIRDRLSNGMLDDIVSDAIANSSTQVSGETIAGDLLHEYLGRDALGNSDETGCDLAHSFEKAVRLANQRNTRSNGGSGADYSAGTTADSVKHLADRVAALEQIVRRLTMADRNHATATDLITSTLNGVTLRGDPIYPTTDNTATPDTAPLLG